MDVTRHRSSGLGRRGVGRLAGIVAACLLVTVWLVGCTEGDTRAGIGIVNDTDREVQIWYEVDGVEMVQRSMRERTTIPPTEYDRYRFDFPNEVTIACTDSPIRARVGEEVVAVIPPGVCANGPTLNLSEWAP